jgi:hypothetical protein
MSADQVAQVREPLAVPALEKLLADGAAPEIARAALAALGAIENDASTRALIRALADPDNAAAAAALLARRTKQTLGPDRLGWDAWWIRSRRPGGKLPPLQAALLAPRTAFAAGEAAAAEWRITNLGTAEVEFELEGEPGRLVKAAAGGEAAPRTAEASPTIRAVRLGPGEFIGGAVDLSPHLGKPGRRRLLWTAPLRLDGKSAPLEALPLVVERTAP